LISAPRDPIKGRDKITKGIFNSPLVKQQSIAQSCPKDAAAAIACIKNFSPVTAAGRMTTWSRRPDDD
jgi:hypothetical protein